MDAGRSINAGQGPPSLPRQARCAVCGNVAEFQPDAGAELPPWGPPCAQCQNEFTEIVPLESERVDQPAGTLGRPEVAPPATPAGQRMALRGLASDHSSRARGPLLTITEFWYTRRASRRLLRLHDAVRSEQPTLTSRARYEEVVVRWCGVDPLVARAILERAEQSVSDWDADRDLRLFDVALYVVSNDYLRAHPERHGARSRMARTVGRIITRDL